jgi:hypothetical protein
MSGLLGNKSTPRNQNSFLFLILQTLPPKRYHHLSFLLGVYRGFGVCSCQPPTAFVLRALLLQNHRQDPCGLRTTMVGHVLISVADVNVS